MAITEIEGYEPERIVHLLVFLMVIKILKILI